MVDLTSINNNIDNYLSDIKNKITDNFQNILNKNKSSCSKLQSALEYCLDSNGKFLRPALVYAGYDIFNNKLTNNSQLLLTSATSIELIHTYSLIHDDLPAMDDDDLRRGKPSCHIKFDEATAILVGDCLQTMAYALLSDISDPKLFKKQLEIIQIISASSGQNGMIAGQSLELNNNFKTIDKLNTIHLLKTAKLITASLQVGSIVADCNSSEYNLITELGHKLGIAFQIQDDILDYTQNSTTLGKPAMSDAKRELDTYVSLLGLDDSQEILSNYWNDCYDIINKLSDNKNSFLKLLIDHIARRDN